MLHTASHLEPPRSRIARIVAKLFAGLGVGILAALFLSDVADASHGRGTDMEASTDGAGMLLIKIADRDQASCEVSVGTTSKTVYLWGGSTSALAESNAESGNPTAYIGSVTITGTCSRSLGSAVREYSGSGSFDLSGVSDAANGNAPYNWIAARYVSCCKVSNIINSGGASSTTSWAAQSVVRNRVGQASYSPALIGEIPLAMNPTELYDQVISFIDGDGGTTSATTLVDGGSAGSQPDWSVAVNVIQDGQGSLLTAGQALPNNRLIIPANVLGFSGSSYVEFKLRVFDDDGEYSEYGYVIIPSSNSAPVISRTGSPGVFSATVTNGATVVWSDIEASDPGAGASGVTFTLGGAPTWVAMQATSSAANATASAVLTFSPEGLEPGTYFFSLNATDNDSSIPLTGSQLIAITIPESPVLTPGNTQIVATWSAPSSPGGTIFDYAVRYRSSTDGGATWTGYTEVNPVTNSATPLAATLTGLTNGTLYSVEYGWNLSDGGAYSWSAESRATPGLVGGLDFQAPVGVLAGGSAVPVTTATPSALNVTFVSSTTSVCRVGLDGRTVSYITPGTCTLTATSQAGDVAGTYYLASTPVTRSFTVSTPLAPGAATITGGRSTPTGFEIDFTVAGDGGSPLTNMEYRIDGGGWVALSPAATTSPMTITYATTPGTTYSIEVRPRNALGTGAASSAVSVNSSAPPSAPVISSLVSQPFGYTVNFAGPTDSGGAPITAYQYRVNGGSWVTLSASVTTSPLTISGLAQGVVYSVEIRAVNVAGGGAASNVVTQRTTIPPPPPPPPVSGPVVVPPPAGPGAGDPEAGDGPGAGDGGVPPVVPGVPEVVRVPLFVPDVVPVPVPVAESLPVVAPGASQALEDGVFVDVVVAQEAPTRWTMTGDGFEWALEIPPSPGVDGGSADGVVTLVRDRTVAVGGFGFAPNSWVDVWILPNGEAVAAKGLTLASVEPIYLGRVQVDADGNFSGDLPVPAGVPDGQHTLQANGRSFDDQVRSLNLGVQVLSADVPSVRLPATGSDVSLLGWALMVLGAGVVVSVRRRLGVPISR
jgi:hypothetical protein